MDSTTAAQIVCLSPPNNFLIENGGLIGSLIASVVALYIAAGGGKWWKQKFFKPILKISGNIKRYRQSHHVWRISITNGGNEIARDVQAEVTRLIINGKPRENFVPMPLSWTHRDTDTRNILPKQTVHLDVIEHYVNNNDKEAHLASPRGHGVPDFRSLEISDQITTLEITIYETGGKLLKTKIEVGWTAPLFLDAKVKGKDWVLGIFKIKK